MKCKCRCRWRISPNASKNSNPIHHLHLHHLLLHPVRRGRMGVAGMSYRNDTGLPSPSSVLRPFIDSTWFSEESQARGTAVHDACHSHLLGRYVVLPRAYRGYFDSFKRWCDAEKPEPVVMETRLLSHIYGYCGQPDFIGRIKSHAGEGVADWKTSAALGKAWALSIAAYRQLYNRHDKPTTWGCSVRLKEDGSFPLVNFYPAWEVDFNKFLGALNLWRHFNLGQ